jgi:hypothetical protein
MILLQRVCGQRGRITQPGRFAAGACMAEPRPWSGTHWPCRSIALRAFCMLPTAFPSLQAHELNPAGPAVRSRPGRRKYFKSNLAAPQHSDVARSEPVELRLELSARTRGVSSENSRLRKTPQFTNRRMRTFIATPSARKVNTTEDPP